MKLLFLDRPLVSLAARLTEQQAELAMSAGPAAAIYGDGSDGVGAFGSADWTSSPPDSTL
jgi:hypothetical protein